MEATRWETLEVLFQQALLLSPEQRSIFIEEACQDDPPLRTELRALLADHDDARDFFDVLGRALLPRLSNILEASLQRTHQRISHYQVLEKLGEGGMGVVYKAHDTRLNRPVALKFLPPHLSYLEAAKKRFIHEAKAASALDHPHIATIYEIDETEEGHLFIAMAYYEGPTLKQQLAEGPMAYGQAVSLVRQVAQGLAKAHEKGIVHRDIKPANVMTTEDGLVKIVDFGLAKMADLGLTRTGTTMGTARYMSPEQAAGEEVDQRTDLWSLGVMLYEMLAGQPPFEGSHRDALLYSIRHDDPPELTQVRPEVPPGLAAAVAACLQKNPADRVASATDLLNMLVGAEPDPVLPSPFVPSRWQSLVQKRYLGVGVGALMILLLGWSSYAFLLSGDRSGVDSQSAVGELPQVRHVAILPNLAVPGDSLDQALAVGLTESMANRLGQIERFEQTLWIESPREIQRARVQQPSEAFQAFGLNLAVVIAAEQGADSLRVDLDLVDAETEQPIRHRRLAHALTDPVALNNTVALALAEMLDVDLQPPVRRLLASGEPTVPGAEQYHLLGLNYLRNQTEGNNLDAAIDLFKQAIATDPDYAPSYASLGQAYLEKFEVTDEVYWTEEAERLCNRALELDNHLLSANLTLGHLQRLQGAYGFAAQAFRTVLDHDPANTDAHRGLADVYLAEGRHADAEAAYQAAINARPDYWGNYDALGVFYWKTQRYKEAIAPFTTVTELAPSNFRGFRNLGATYHQLGDPVLAEQYLLKAKEIEPDYSNYSNLATLYFYEGDYQKAARMYEEVLRLRDTNYKVWGWLATSYLWTPAEASKANAAFEQAVIRAEEQLALNPRDQEVMAHLASHYAHLGEAEKARVLLAQLEAADPKTGEILFRIATVYEQLGERTAALAWLEKALQQDYSLVEVQKYPGLRALREDPAFQELIIPFHQPIEEQEFPSS